MSVKTAKRSAKYLNTSSLNRPLMMLGAATALLAAGPAYALDANTLPQDPNVAGGSASFSQSGNTLNVNQSTNRAVIDWRSFDIGSNAQTNFAQPNSGSIAVNRVNQSANPTQIQGGLHANGQVWILNPNGVVFGKTAHVDAAGIVASTANIDVNAFMGGSNTLHMSGAAHGSVVNKGSISVGESGLAAFVAPSVRNSGTITAKVGKVTLAAGTSYTLDLAGDDLVEIGLGAGNALVDQSGKIVNAGGTVQLSAKAASDVVDSIINVSGVVDASSVVKDGGTIVLAGDNINTSSTAKLAADAGTNGNGGTITSIANKTGNYAGSFSAKGGSASGDGGQIETSGKTISVSKDVSVNTLAANGKTGNWTLDPDDLTVQSGSGDTLSGSSNTDGQSSIEAGTVVTALDSTDVTLQARNSITVNSAIDASGNTNAHNLALADQNTDSNLTVNLNAPITLKSGGVLSGQGTIVNVGAGSLIQNGVDVALAGGATVNLGTGSFDGAVNVNKDGLTISGVSGTVVNVVSGTDTGHALANSAFQISGDNITIKNLDIVGPVSGDYRTVDWGAFAEGYSWGIRVLQNASNVAIQNTSIKSVRSGVTIDGRGNTGTKVIGNTIENTKGAVLVQYNAGDDLDISGNQQGPLGNEWGIVLNLNTGTPTNSAAPDARQAHILSLSQDNNNWSVMDRAYQLANRSSVFVDDDSAATAADDFSYGNGLGNERQPLKTVQSGVYAVVAGGTVNVLAGTYAGNVLIEKGITLAGAGMDETHLTGGIDLSSTPPISDLVFKDFTVSGASSNAVVKGGKVTNFTMDHVRIDGENVAGQHGFASGKFYGDISITNSEFVNIRGWSSFDNSTGSSPTALTSVVFSNNLLDNTIGHITFRGAAPNAPVTISSNIVRNVGDTSNLSGGIFKVFGATTVDFTNNNITGIAAIPGKIQNGINDGAALIVRDVATLNVTGNTFTDNQEAILVDNGKTLPVTTNLTGNTFTNNAYDINYGNGVGAANIVFDAGNNFVSGAQTQQHLIWGGTSNIDMTQVQFDGKLGSAMTNDELFATEDLITDGLDNGTSGFASLKAGNVYVTQASGSIQNGVNAASSGNTINVQAGSYTLPGQLNINKSLTLSGAGVGSTNITSNSTGYGIKVTADNTTLSGFTYNGPTAGSYGIKVQPDTGDTTDRILNFAINNVTINGGKKTGLDLNGVLGGTIDNVSVSGITNGNGITLTDSANVTITNSTTTGNAWGGLALYQANKDYDQQVDHITIAANNHFNELNPVYFQDESDGTTAHGGATGLNFGSDITVAGYSYAVLNPNGRTQNDGQQFVWLQNSQQSAIDFAMGTFGMIHTDQSTVQGWDGSVRTNIFTVGTATGGSAMSIGAAVGTATSGGTINVLAGTYGSFGTSFGGPANLTIQTSDNAVIDGATRPSNNRIVDLRADGTTFTGFTITSDGGGVGISISGQGVTVSGNTITNALTGVQTTTANAIGNNTISGNTINTQYGVSLQNTGNTVSGNSVTASAEGVGLLQSANTFSGNTFNIGAAGNALAYYGSATATGLVASGNTVNIQGGGVQGAVDLAGASGALNLAAGTYTLPGQLGITQNNLTLTGAGEGSTTIDGSGVASGYAIDVAANNVSLGGFTLNGSSDLGGIDVQTTAAAGAGATGFQIANVTINNQSGYGMSVVGGSGATIDNLTVDGSTGGDVGVAINDSANVTITNTKTSGNEIGLGVYQTGDTSSQQLTGLSVDTTNNFSEDAPVYILDAGTGGQELGALSILGFGYAIGNTTDLGNAAVLQTTQQNAINNSVALTTPSDSFVVGWTGSAVTTTYTVGTSTGGTAMSIAAALGHSASGNTINVLTGTYGEAVNVTGLRTLNFGTVTLNSLTLGAGAAGSSLTGTIAAGSVALNGAVTLSGATTLNTSAANGNVTTSAIDGNQALTINAGTGAVSLGNLGATTRLDAVSVTGPATLTGTTYAANSLSLGSATLSGDTTLDTTGALTTGAVDGAHALTVKAASASLGNLGATTRLGAVSVTGPATLTGTTYAANSLSLGSATLSGDTTLDTTGALTTGAVDGAHALTVKAASASLGNLGATTRLGAVSVTGPATLTGTTYAASSQAYGGSVTLTGNTTMSSVNGGGITVAGNLFGATDGGQSLTLNAGSGTGALLANGDISLQNVGTSGVRLNNLTVSGNNFSAATVYLAGNYTATLLGNQVFTSQTLNAGGTVNSDVGGNAIGPINAGGAVNMNVGGNLTGNVNGTAITLNTGSITGSTITGTTSITANSNTISTSVFNAPAIDANAGTVQGTLTGDTITLDATQFANVVITGKNVNVDTPAGVVSGTWDTIGTDGSGILVINGETTLGLSGIGPNQLVVEGFALPAGTTVTPSGALVLPTGVLVGLLSPAGASGQPKVVLVHSVQRLGELLANGYTAIVIDLNNKKKEDKEIIVASN